MYDDTYPGSMQYFMIDGRRFSSRSGYYADLNAAAVAALKQDPIIDFTYTDWPYRNEISRKDVFSGFAKAYDDCVRFLGGDRSKPSSNPPRSPPPAAPLPITPTP